MPEKAGTPAEPRRTGQSAADLLFRFLTAERAQREMLAPRVVAAVGGERLDQILDGTRERVGAITGVRDHPDGLVIEGTRGRALAFATTHDGQVLDGLLIAPGPYRVPRLRVPHGARAALVWTVWVLLLAARIDACWQAPSASPGAAVCSSSRPATCSWKAGRARLGCRGGYAGPWRPARWWPLPPRAGYPGCPRRAAVRPNWWWAWPCSPTSDGSCSGRAATAGGPPCPGLSPSPAERKVVCRAGRRGPPEPSRVLSRAARRPGRDPDRSGRCARMRHRPARGKRELSRVRAESLRPV